ncbi:MAG: hypothetical protein Kow0037_30780 [Calditrichia bacterium]
MKNILTEKIKLKMTALLLALFLWPVNLPAEWKKVVRVIDGDTVVLEDGTRVRVKGIDTPETRHPRLGEEPGGREATNLAKNLLLGKTIWLEGTATDQYGRRVAEITLPDGSSYSERIRRAGLDKHQRSGTITGGWQSFYPRNGGKSSTRKRQYKKSGFPGYRKSSVKQSNGKVYIRGYYRKNGTYVRPHYRSRGRK